MRTSSIRFSTLVFAAAALTACSSSVDQPVTPLLAPGSASHSQAPTAPALVISQIYGGGGNGGGIFSNDFIELFNPGSSPVTMTNWSVQYASQAGTSWQVTAISGTVPPGGYFLVQEAIGANNPPQPALPTPDATGIIPMSASNAKVALVQSTTALSGTCPSTGWVDLVPYGTNGCDGSTPSFSHAPALSNTTAAIRSGGGCAYTGSALSDFTSGTPTPRNSAHSANLCTGGGDPATVTVTPSPTTVTGGGTRALFATAKDADGNVVSTTFTWASADAGTASVDAATGVVTGHILGGSATISATSANGKIGSSVVTVTNISVTTRSTPMPVGFQTQLFAIDQNTQQSVPATWTSSDPSKVMVDPATGVITAVEPGPGSAVIKAVAADNSVDQTTITTETLFLSGSTRTGHNLEFGTPVDGNSSDDIIVARKQYTLSWNPTHAGPNWVSWNMDATHLGSLDRCNCFTADTALTRLGFTAFNTNDYIAGGLWDRGHMEPSADQTTTDTENANTFFLSNTLPQKHDLNAGPWEKLEIALRDSAKAPGGREVYVIAGGIFTGGVGLGTLNDAGKIGIPDSTWKIALILPAGKGLADVHSPSDMSVIAVNMPNVVGIINDDWPKYAATTTIAKIEKSTGYNFLNLLDEAIQCKVEVRNCLPVPHMVSSNGSSTTQSGAAFTLDVGTTDADGADGPWKLNLQWGDGSAPYNTTLYALLTDQHPFARAHIWTGAPGTQYTAVVTITDKHGGVGTASFTVTIAP